MKIFNWCYICFFVIFIACNDGSNTDADTAAMQVDTVMEETAYSSVDTTYISDTVEVSSGDVENETSVTTTSDTLPKPHIIKKRNNPAPQVHVQEMPMPGGSSQDKHIIDSIKAARKKIKEN
ncbi:MAG: hypothetical protein HYZ42_03580 [Bacteroidetes bacterium]|nr:hypothetical protein [Bacteroidota bacterium]